LNDDVRMSQGMPRLLLRLVVGVALCCSGAVTAQSASRVLIDLGVEAFPTAGSVASAWNDIDPTNMAGPLALIDRMGQPTGVSWSIDGTGFVAGNSAGTSAPVPGSPLGQFPATATQDVLYGSNGTTVLITLAGFAPASLVNLTFGASRLNVSDMRTTDYVVKGFNGGQGTLDPSNNTTDTTSVPTILADATGTITVAVRAAPSNTNLGTFYYYLGLLQLDITVWPTTPPVLGFDQGSLAVSVSAGQSPFVTPLTVSDSLGALSTIQLSAVDDATGLAPTWLALPPAATPGQPFAVSFGDNPVPEGNYSATVVASAPGYPDELLGVSYEVDDAAGKNLLFYGNSYSISNQGVPSLVGFIAEEAGHPSPTVVAQLVGGQTLNYHLTNPSQAAAISGSLSLGQTWDSVVMQGFSTEATDAIGDPLGFRDDALAILTAVRAHSPDAGAAMYQTWARGPGSPYYPNTWADPLEMHGEVRTNYRLAVDDMNAAFGPGTAFLGAAGDAVALLSFDSSLYTPDWSHPTAPTTVLAAMTLYQALYRERICDLEPDFGGSGNLVSRLSSLGLGQSDWATLAGIAERVADGELRHHPGSGEDLLLQTGVDSTALACPVKGAALGSQLSIELTSPNDLFSGATSMLLVDAFLTGSPPGLVPGYPEVQFNPATFLIAVTQNPLGAGLTLDVPLTTSLAGVSVLVQGVSLSPSVETGNGKFTTSDGHEFQLQ